jgi:UDP-N-acetylglucosamine pyrophosphorylase
MKYDIECTKIETKLTNHFELMGLVSDAVYNNQRYAYNTNFVLIELNPPCKKVCTQIDDFIRQTDRFLKIDDRFCVLEYSFVDYISACKAFNNLETKILEANNISYRFSLMSISDNSNLNASEVIKTLSAKVCQIEFT